MNETESSVLPLSVAIIARPLRVALSLSLLKTNFLDSVTLIYVAPKTERQLCDTSSCYTFHLLGLCVEKEEKENND